MVGWVGGWVGGFFQEIFPLRGSILQAGTCQILRLAENPRWSQVWQLTVLKCPQDIVLCLGAKAD